MTALAKLLHQLGPFILTVGAGGSPQASRVASWELGSCDCDWRWQINGIHCQWRRRRAAARPAASCELKVYSKGSSLGLANTVRTDCRAAKYLSLIGL